MHEDHTPQITSGDEAADSGSSHDLPSPFVDAVEAALADALEKTTAEQVGRGQPTGAGAGGASQGP
jgi:hypothetical protein